MEIKERSCDNFDDEMITSFFFLLLTSYIKVKLLNDLTIILWKNSQLKKMGKIKLKKRERKSAYCSSLNVVEILLSRRRTH